MTILQTTAASQARWSETANSLHALLRRTRLLVLVLSSGAALLAAVASQTNSPDGSKLHLVLAIASTVLLATVSYLSGRLLTSARGSNWVRVRTASEALKRLVYMFASGADPYQDPATCDIRLRDDREAILKDVDDLDGLLVPKARRISAPIEPISPDEYLQRRVKASISWYESKADQYKGNATRLRVAEFVLSLVAAVVVAAAAVNGASAAVDKRFDLAALTAVLTTIAAALLSHIEAGRYDYLICSYRAAARRLSNEIDALPVFAKPSAEWSAFVSRCEAIISEENMSWAAKWTKD